MKLENLPEEFVITDELLDLEWMSNLNVNQTFFRDQEKTFQSVNLSLESDEINALVSNLPLNQNKSAENIDTAIIKEFALIGNPFYLNDTEEEILELDGSFN